MSRIVLKSTSFLPQDKNAPSAVILFSIIALEKFAQTSENKVTIQKRVEQICCNSSVLTSEIGTKSHPDVKIDCGDRLLKNGPFNFEQKNIEAAETETSNNPLVQLETWLNEGAKYSVVRDENAFMRHQVGFCAQWCLDNLCEF